MKVTTYIQCSQHTCHVCLKLSLSLSLRQFISVCVCMCECVSQLRAKPKSINSKYLTHSAIVFIFGCVFSSHTLFSMFLQNMDLNMLYYFNRLLDLLFISEGVKLVCVCAGLFVLLQNIVSFCIRQCAQSFIYFYGLHFNFTDYNDVNNISPKILGDSKGELLNEVNIRVRFSSIFTHCCCFAIAVAVENQLNEK